MNIIKLALIGLALGSAASMAGECAAPALPTLPDGATATMDQMLAGQKAVKEYQAANSEYRACLDPQLGLKRRRARGQVQCRTARLQDSAPRLTSVPLGRVSFRAVTSPDQQLQEAQWAFAVGHRYHIASC